MKSVDELLNTVKAPEPSEALKARILKQARTAEQHPVSAANDNAWIWIGSLAASFLAVAIIGTSILAGDNDHIDDDNEIWAEAATSIGYDDLYDWVYEDETNTDR